MSRQQNRRKDIEVGRRNWRTPERGREKEGTHSRKLLDASHKHLAQTPRWDAGQQAASSKLMGRAGRVNSILGHMCVWKEARRESK